MRIGYIIYLYTRPSLANYRYIKGRVIEWPFGECDYNFERGSRYFEQIIGKKIGCI